MNLSDTLFRLARRIAPDHRKAWIDAMKTEAAQAGNRTGWAAGAITTASRERLIDLTISGALPRALGGAFVMGTGLASLPFLVRILILIQDRHVDAPDRGNATVSLVLICTVMAGLIATGVAIMVAGKNRPARIAAKTIVVLMTVGLGSLLTWLGGHSIQAHNPLSPFQQEMTWWTLATGPALLIAAAAMALRRPRLFLAAAMAALGAQTGQWLLELSHHAVTGMVPSALAFYSACLPALLMLAATGLLINPRRAT